MVHTFPLVVVVVLNVDVAVDNWLEHVGEEEQWYHGPYKPWPVA